MKPSQKNQEILEIKTYFKEDIRFVPASKVSTSSPPKKALNKPNKQANRLFSQKQNQFGTPDNLRLPTIKQSHFYQKIRHSIANSSENLFSSTHISRSPKINKIEKTLLKSPTHLETIFLDKEKNNKTFLQLMKKSHEFQDFSISNQYHFRYYITPGNNSELVKKLIDLRKWKQTDDPDNAHFRWSPTDYNFKYDKLLPSFQNRQLFNHFQFHREITTKSALIRNLKIYCERKSMNVFDMTPATFIINLDSRNVENDLASFAQFYFRNLPGKFQDDNNKNEIEGRKADDSVHPHNLQLVIKAKLREYFLHSCKPYLHKSFTSNNSYLWLLKVTGLNRGRGIYVFQDIKKLEHLLNQFYEGFIEDEIVENEDSKKVKKKKLYQVIQQKSSKKPQTQQPQQISPQQTPSVSQQQTQTQAKQHEKQQLKVINILFIYTLYIKPNEVFIKWSSFVIQKYVEKPLLIRGRKFDIRMWVLITHNMDLFICREGYLRTSCEKYTLDEAKQDDPYIHLTNNAIQKQSTNYGQFEAGNQLSFEDFKAYIAEQNFPVNFEDQILSKMKHQIVHASNSVRNKLNKNDCRFCFELFGYDFIIDQFFNVWLIEVNTNPCIEISSPLLKQLIPRMINDAFNLTVDQLFPCKECPDMVHHVNEYIKKLKRDVQNNKTTINIQDEAISLTIPEIIGKTIVSQKVIEIRQQEGEIKKEDLVKQEKKVIQEKQDDNMATKQTEGQSETKSKKKDQRKLKKIKENEKKYKHQNYNFYEEYDEITRQIATKKQYNYEIEEYFKNILSKSDLEENDKNNVSVESHTFEHKEKAMEESSDLMAKNNNFLNEEMKEVKTIDESEIQLNFQEKMFIYWRSHFELKGYNEFQNIWEFSQNLGINYNLGYT